MNPTESSGAPGRARKWLRIGGGFVLIAVGLILSIPGVPGPGILVLIIGLVMLSEHYHWARRTLDWARRNLDFRRRKHEDGDATKR